MHPAEKKYRVDMFTYNKNVFCLVGLFLVGNVEEIIVAKVACCFGVGIF